MRNMSRADFIRYLRNRPQLFVDSVTLDDGTSLSIPNPELRQLTPEEEGRLREERKRPKVYRIDGREVTPLQYVKALKRKYGYAGQVPDMTREEGSRPTWEEYAAILDILFPVQDRPEA
jgi:hypothetical protein